MGEANQHLRLGIIGLSHGNGHPYSWAAICNGYNRSAMEQCEFPAIPAYLNARKFPDDFLRFATVTHVWTQDAALSRKIADASRIEHVCGDFREMLGHVDGLLLARDDAENHFDFASPFLKAGIPVYVDKPFALSRQAAGRLLGAALEPWHIFSCSALYFAPELLLNAGQRTQLGTIHTIHGVTPKPWETYAVHLADPILRQLPEGIDVAGHFVWRENAATHVSVRWTNGLITGFHATGRNNCGIRIHYIGERGERLTLFQDSFHAFKTALEAFCDQVRRRQLAIPRSHLLRVTRVLELGAEDAARS